MLRTSNWYLVTGSFAILLGGLCQQVFSFGVSGPNYYCDTMNYTECPHVDICHMPSHCGVLPYHKCVTSSSFGKCTPLGMANCAQALQGCKFEEWSTGCGTPTGVYFKPFCYDECGSPF